jgi:hypothetical protein
MTVLSSDTHPKMEALQIRLWQQASPARKMHMLAQLNASMRRQAGLLLGEEVGQKVYGDVNHAK